MANNITGDFDVVAEFSVPAVNRLLAGMHQCGRFLHSISARVDDNPRPTRPNWPVVVGAVDAFGDPVANHAQVGTPNPFPSGAAIASGALAHTWPVINPDQLVAHLPPIVPSHISGVAQLQLFPPTVVPPTTAGGKLSVRMNLMSRFFPDKDTAPLAEFMRGDLEISAPINKVATGRIHVLDIDFKAEDATVSFTPSYTSHPLTAEDAAGINLCIQNGLRTSFLPSSVTLPSSITNVQLRTLPGALAVLLDLTSHPSNPNSVSNVFLGSDDFAFGVGRDYLLSVLRAISDNILSQTFQPVKFTVDLSIWGVGTTLHYSYPITVNSAAFDLKPPDKVMLTIKGHAGPEAHGHPPSDLNFTITVNFSLVPSGPTVTLQVGHISVDTDSTLASILDFFTGNISDSVRSAVAIAISNTNANAMVDKTLNADTNLGNFLNAQLKPTDGSAPAQPQHLFLVYNSVEVQTGGIILRGSLLLFDWPKPYVEFEPIPPNLSNTQLGGVLTQGTDYSAFKTWIPGGTISQFEWSVEGQQQSYPFDVDPNRFVLLQSGPVVAADIAGDSSVLGYSPLCLTVRGTRISNFGPPTYHQVSASVCGFRTFNLGLLEGILAGKASAPMLAITRPSHSGEVQVSAHALAQIDRSGRSASNLIVHFADSESLADLPVIGRTLKESKRTNAPTAIIAVLTPDQLPKAKHVPGVVYSDDVEGWHKALNLKLGKRPLTVIVNRKGFTTWQHEGEIDPKLLITAANKYLLKGDPIPIASPRLNTRIGQPAPDFVFEYSPGRLMPLSKLEGQSVVLVFWRAGVKASVEAVRELEASRVAANQTSQMVLAINNGDTADLARRTAAETKLTAIVVTDPNSKISRAYGVQGWPTIVHVSPSGKITGIANGLHEHAKQTAARKR